MLMAVVNAPQAVTAGGIINLTTQVQRGCCARNNAGAIELKCGCYLVNVSASITGTGTATIQLNNNGVAIQSAKATETLTAGDTSNVAFSAIVNVNPSCRCTDNTTVLQLQVLDVNVTVENAVVTVVKCNG